MFNLFLYESYDSTFLKMYLNGIATELKSCRSK